ncbi:unnamed protein product [Phytophthora fragariaefolia]|uniref:Unnamed protein product n=1 Tax=Phytophthora fragariaefolia TaxID=1490495 RepID=A0A9W6YPL3_9STRA|nr:unnamed protein product [Phytophthora fragariaefolia]
MAQWLISAGMPHHTSTIESFKLLIQRLTGDSGATILAASTFRDLLRAVFAKFCDMAKDLLEQDFKAAHRSPFLNLHHDGWTAVNGKISAMGASASFIDRFWRYRELALLLTVGNPSHVSSAVHQSICTHVMDLYDVDINTMVQFTISDTTSSARKVSKLFEDSVQTDCTMHILNLCLQYAMGFVKTRKPLKSTIRTDQRCSRLEDVQEFYCLPNIKSMVDCDTRVAFTVKLFQETILNYSAFRAYFQKADDSSVFDNLKLADWKLVAEMEAIVGSIADLVRIEVQRNELVTSELILLLKFAADRLKNDTFWVCDLDAIRTKSTTVASFPRYETSAKNLSKLSQTCLARMKGQVEQRIPTATPETALILFFGPRAKFSVESLVWPFREYETNESDMCGGPALQTRNLMASAKKLFIDAHREVFTVLNSSRTEATNNAATGNVHNLSLIPSSNGEKIIFGAPLTVVSNDTTTTSSALHDKADKIVEGWIQFTSRLGFCCGASFQRQDKDQGLLHAVVVGSTRRCRPLEG